MPLYDETEMELQHEAAKLLDRLLTKVAVEDIGHGKISNNFRKLLFKWHKEYKVSSAKLRRERGW